MEEPAPTPPLPTSLPRPALQRAVTVPVPNSAAAAVAAAAVSAESLTKEWLAERLPGGQQPLSEELILGITSQKEQSLSRTVTEVSPAQPTPQAGAPPAWDESICPLSDLGRTHPLPAAKTSVEGECKVCFDHKRLPVICGACPVGQGACADCLKTYFTTAVHDALYAVPAIRCPLCRGRISTAAWAPFVDAKTHDRYLGNATALLSLRCPHCDETGSFFASGPPAVGSSGTGELAEAKRRAARLRAELQREELWCDLLTARATASRRRPRRARAATVEDKTSADGRTRNAAFFLTQTWWRFSAAEASADEFVARLHSCWPPNLGAGPASSLRRAATQRVPLCIEDPERRLAMQLAWLRRYPKVKTPCCAARICFKCKVRGWHRGISCEERQRREAGRQAQFCPNCQVPTTRSDGCNDIRCVCGADWTWNEAAGEGEEDANEDTSDDVSGVSEGESSYSQGAGSEFDGRPKTALELAALCAGPREQGSEGCEVAARVLTLMATFPRKRFPSTAGERRLHRRGQRSPGSPWTAWKADSSDDDSDSEEGGAEDSERRAREQVRCPEGHRLVLMPPSGIPMWICDGCNTRETGKLGRHRCNRCDFDLCPSCYQERKSPPGTPQEAGSTAAAAAPIEDVVSASGGGEVGADGAGGSEKADKQEGCADPSQVVLLESDAGPEGAPAPAPSLAEGSAQEQSGASEAPQTAEQVMRIPPRRAAPVNPSLRQAGRREVIGEASVQDGGLERPTQREGAAAGSSEDPAPAVEGGEPSATTTTAAAAASSASAEGEAESQKAHVLQPTALPLSLAVRARGVPAVRALLEKGALITEGVLREVVHISDRECRWRMEDVLAPYLQKLKPFPVPLWARIHFNLWPEEPARFDMASICTQACIAIRRQRDESVRKRYEAALIDLLGEEWYEALRAEGATHELLQELREAAKRKRPPDAELVKELLAAGADPQMRASKKGHEEEESENESGDVWMDGGRRTPWNNNNEADEDDMGNRSDYTDHPSVSEYWCPSMHNSMACEDLVALDGSIGEELSRELLGLELPTAEPPQGAAPAPDAAEPNEGTAATAEPNAGSAARHAAALGRRRGRLLTKALHSANLTVVRQLLASWGTSPLPAASWRALHSLARDAPRRAVEDELLKFIRDRGLEAVEVPLWALIQMGRRPADGEGATVPREVFPTTIFCCGLPKAHAATKEDFLAHFRKHVGSLDRSELHVPINTETEKTEGVILMTFESTADADRAAERLNAWSAKNAQRGGLNVKVLQTERMFGSGQRPDALEAHKRMLQPLSWADFKSWAAQELPSQLSEVLLSAAAEASQESAAKPEGSQDGEAQAWEPVEEEAAASVRRAGSSSSSSSGTEEEKKPAAASEEAAEVAAPPQPAAAAAPSPEVEVEAEGPPPPPSPAGPAPAALPVEEKMHAEAVSQLEALLAASSGDGEVAHVPLRLFVALRRCRDPAAKAFLQAFFEARLGAKTAVKKRSQAASRELLAELRGALTARRTPDIALAAELLRLGASPQAKELDDDSDGTEDPWMPRGDAEDDGRPRAVLDLLALNRFAEPEAIRQAIGAAIQLKADPNQSGRARPHHRRLPERGWNTPLTLALRYKHAAAAKALLEGGADVTKQALLMVRRIMRKEVREELEEAIFQRFTAKPTMSSVQDAGLWAAVQLGYVAIAGKAIEGRAPIDTWVATALRRCKQQEARESLEASLRRRLTSKLFEALQAESASVELLLELREAYTDKRAPEEALIRLLLEIGANPEARETQHVLESGLPDEPDDLYFDEEEDGVPSADGGSSDSEDSSSSSDSDDELEEVVVHTDGRRTRRRRARRRRGHH